MSIIIYTKTGCPWCADALAFLNGAHILFEERNVTENPAYFKEMKEKSGQEKAPTLDLDGFILADTDAEAIEKYLRSKGTIA